MTGTVPVNKELLTGTVPVNNLFHKLKEERVVTEASGNKLNINSLDTSSKDESPSDSSDNEALIRKLKERGY